MPPASQPVTDFQRAMVENYRSGRFAELAGAADLKKLTAALRKEPEAAALALMIEKTKGLDDVNEVGAVLMSSEVAGAAADVNDALAAVGAVAMTRHGYGR